MCLFIFRCDWQVARDSHLARQKDAHEGKVGLHASVQEQQVRPGVVHGLGVFFRVTTT